ncbi:MAG: hypothetical protein HF973_01620 [Chloroflexi bacterium]|nr:hypothetical protein [Chloroflexota bacterium]
MRLMGAGLLKPKNPILGADIAGRVEAVGKNLILAVNGYHPLSDYKRALNPNGLYVAAGGFMAQVFQAILLGPLISIEGIRNWAAWA